MIDVLEEFGRLDKLEGEYGEGGHVIEEGRKVLCWIGSLEIMVELTMKEGAMAKSKNMQGNKEEKEENIDGMGQGSSGHESFGKDKEAGNIIQEKGEKGGVTAW